MKMNDGLTLILKQNFDCNLDCDKYNCNKFVPYLD